MQTFPDQRLFQKICLANENHLAVRTYELNLLFTGGWPSALASIKAGIYGSSP